jgi:iron complex outermembrane receptor protein
MKKAALALLVVTSISTAAPVWAEEIAQVEQIVVQETEEVKAMEERKESPYAKIVITKKEMEELGGQTAADVLRRMPRLYFSGPPAYNKDIRMAGLDKEFQNVMINGVRPPGSGEKREFLLELVPIELIDRIEIVKNPTAAYDSDAVGGLVNIVLKDPPKEKETVSFSLGTSFNDLADHWGNKVAVSYGEAGDVRSYTLGLIRNDEYKSKQKETVEGTKQKFEDEDTRYITTSFNPVLTYRKEDQVFTFRSSLLEQRQDKVKETPTYVLSTGALSEKTSEFEDKENRLDSYGLEWERRMKDGALVKMSASYSENTEEKDKIAYKYDKNLVLKETTTEDELKNEKEMVLTADYRKTFLDVWSADHIISFGVKQREKDRLQQKLKTKNGADTTSATENFSLEENITSFYFVDEAIINDRLSVLPGIRMEHTTGSYTTAAGVTGEGNYTDWNPSLHTVYKLGKSYQLRMSAARTISRPAFKDMVPTEKINDDNDTIERGNPDLKPARSKNYEMAIEKYIGKNNIISFGAFSKDIQDTIEKREVGTDADTGYTITQPVNVGDSTVDGVEIEIKTDLNCLGWKNLTLTSSYSWIHSEVLDLDTGLMRALKDVPERMGSMVLRYDNKKSGWGASIGMNYVGEKINAEDSTKVKVEQPFTQWDASVTKTLPNATQWFVSAVNLFNEKKVKTEPNKTEIEYTGRSYYIGMKREL